MKSRMNTGLNRGYNAVLGATNQVKNFSTASATVVKSWLSSFKVVVGLIVLVFVGLVLYNKTIGESVSVGWNRVQALFKRDTEVNIAIDPGQTGHPAVTATLTPQEELTPPTLPALTAALLPEPVTVSTPEDNPPSDNVDVPPEDRPAGFPGSSVVPSLSESILSSLHGKVPEKKEVFNISRNIYTFNQAAAVCAAADAELATYDQVKDAYDNGAEWCNYGWVKGQMAVYPTQKSTYKKLQKGSPEFRNACGLPGVNGGYFDNPELTFGVNCYGAKPAQKASDELLDSQVALPQSAEEIEFEKEVQKFRDQMDNATILPFHKGRWSE
jgi:hypothetical protein